MKFIITREQLFQSLQFATGVVERRQNMPILANILLRIEDKKLAIVGTDLEIELTSYVVPLEVHEAGHTTVSGRKLMDICRALPENSQLIFHQEDNKVTLTAGKSRFSLATLPANDFPIMATDPNSPMITLPSAELLQLLETTYFAMAQQDVRYYLNGLFFELTAESIHTVATDGHRLSLRSLPFSGVSQPAQFILPRKGIMELLRLLNKEEGETLQIHYSANILKLAATNFVFVSRLIDGRFPDYHRVIPKNGDKVVLIDRDLLRQVLQRVAILSNEKFHAVRLHIKPGLLTIHATNNEMEEAQDELAIDYTDTALEMGFNVNYLLDVLGALPMGNVKMTLSNSENSVLIESESLKEAVFVIMPMCL